MVRKLLKRAQRAGVVIYTKPNWADCHKAERFFATKGVPIVLKDIDFNLSAREELVKLAGFPAVPALVIDGELFLGFEANRQRIESRLP